MIRKTVSKSIALAAALTMAAGTAPAFAAPSAAPSLEQPAAEAGITEELIGEARAFLAEYGVDAATADELIRKFEAGEKWDSLSGAKPVTTETSMVGSSERTVARFADGSLSVSSIQMPSATTPSGADSIQDVSECSYAYVDGVEYYDNCLVDFFVFPIKMGFRADFVARDNAMDSITSVYAPDYFIGGASSVDQTEFAVTRPDETVSGAPATARLTVKAFPMGAPLQYTFWVQLNVGYGGAYMTYSG